MGICLFEMQENLNWYRQEFVLFRRTCITGDKIMATKIKIAMVSKDLTQRELAEKVGVSETTISAIVRGESEPKVGLAVKIAKVLEKTVEELWEFLI
jgi:putative transcriptional regulator